MRKYKMPKILYAMLAIVLLVLAVDYTYAYFSARTTATGKMGMADMAVEWMQSYTIGDEYNFENLPNSSTGEIDISENEIKRSTYTDIMYNGNAITLMLSATVETPAYCRIKLDASYIKTNSTEKVNCGQYIKLAYNGTLLEESYTWRFENGYYYYKSGSILTTLAKGNTMFDVANQLYLDPSSSSEIYGKELTIKLKVELVQSSYVTVGTDVWAD